MMARKSPTALGALQKLRDERRDLETREAEARHAAAIEIGKLALAAGADRLDPTALTAAIVGAVKAQDAASAANSAA